jgi:signal transduction histidine kinase
MNSSRVLIVDDHPTNRKLLRINLEADGYEVAEAENGQVALEVLGRDNIQVVISDLLMPVMDGYRLCDEIRHRDPIKDIPFIVYSATYTSQADEQLAMDIGADRFIRKPAPWEVITKALEDALSDRLSGRRAVPANSTADLAVVKEYSEVLVRKLEDKNQDLQVANERLDKMNEALRSNEELRKRADQEMDRTHALLQKKNRRLAKLNRTAHEFVDNLSHEFRTPLTVIKEYASLVRDGVVGAVSDEQKSMLTVVEDRADDMNTMVDDMLDVSKLKSGLLGIRRQECQVAEILEHVRPGLERKAAAKGVALEFEVDPLLPTLFCDPEKAGRVLMNLTTNAIKFCGQPGRVRLSCQRESDGTGVKFSVSDDGNGISPENQEAIFRRFKQLGESNRSSTKGFGLGLNIAKQLVELNLGAISVESQLDQGSTFSFTLPPADPREALWRYLKWIELRRNGSSQLALVEANVEGSTSATLAADVNLFLNHLLHSTDLLFRRGPTQWLVVLPVAEIEVAKFCERVAKKRVLANRNRLGGPLPDIHMKFLCSCRVGSDREELLNRLASALNPAEVHFVGDHIPPVAA